MKAFSKDTPGTNLGKPVCLTGVATTIQNHRGDRLYLIEKGGIE
jgi:hypothetical protein